MTTACCKQVLEILSMVRTYQAVGCLVDLNLFNFSLGKSHSREQLIEADINMQFFDAAFVTGDQLSSSTASPTDLCHNSGYPRRSNRLVGKTRRINEI